MNFLKRRQTKKTLIIPFSEFSGGREQRVRPERRAIQSYFLIALMLWGVFVCTLSSFLFFSGETTIVDIAFFGQDRISAADLRDIVRMDMEGRHLRVFPRNNFFFLPKEKILSDIRDFSPVIGSVSVERSFPNGLAVRIGERSSVIVWRSMNGDFVLDEAGVARSHPNIHSVLDDPSTVILWDEEGRETTVGDAVIDASLDTFIPECMQKFESRFGKTMTPEVRVISRFSGELLFHVEGGFDMMVDGHQSIDDTLMTLQAALNRGIPESDRDRLARVDLRTANKVYYTVKGE